MALINKSPLNSVVLNGASQDNVIATTSGDLLQIEQKVAILASGDLLQIEQAVELVVGTSGDLLQFEQKVNTIDSGDLLQLAQRVISGNTQFYTVNGFEPIVTIGGQSIDADNLVENIRVTFTENDSATAIINILLDAGTYDLYSYQGKTATIDVRTSSGTDRIFTGWVDLPKADVLNERIELNCVADRRELLEDKVNKNLVGRYSSIISGDKDKADEIEERLLAVASSLDFDGNNNWSLVSWTPKASPDFTLTNSDVFRRAPNVSIERRNQIINQVNINFKYGYTRSYHVNGSFVWNHPYATSGICTFLKDYPDIPTKDMIRQAIDGAGWQYNSALIGWTPLPVTGSYNCSGTTVLWTTTPVSDYVTQIQRDANGNPVTDSNGNNLYENVSLSIVDLNDIYTMGAAWNASTRFNQNITEDYTVTVRSTKSQSRYGLKARDVTYTYIDPFDASSWEQYNKHDTAVPSGAVQNGSSYYLNRDNNSDKFDNAIQTAISRARTEILANHRDSVITFQRDFWKDVKLKHTVALPGTRWIAGKGKVFSYTHNIDVNGADHWTEVQLKAYRSTESETDSSVSAPSRPSDLLNAPSFALALQSHYGQEPIEAWTGHIGNIWVTERIGVGTNFYRTQYQEEFRVDVPAISETYRNTRILSTSATYGVSIPQDNVSVIAHGFTI